MKQNASFYNNMVLPERRTHIMLYYLDDNELSETISHLHADVVVF